MTDTELAQIRERWAKATPGKWVHSNTYAVRLKHNGPLVAGANNPDDAVAIAHSKSDIKRLLAEVERLRKR